MTARDEQVGGDHYCQFKIQPRDIAVEYQLEYEEVQALKYLLRHRRKNGAEDIDKAIHCLQLLKERLYKEAAEKEYGPEPSVVKNDNSTYCRCLNTHWLTPAEHHMYCRCYWGLSRRHSGQMIGGHGEPPRYPHLHKGKPGC